MEKIRLFSCAWVNIHPEGYKHGNTIIKNINASFYVSLLSLYL